MNESLFGGNRNCQRCCCPPITINCPNGCIQEIEECEEKLEVFGGAYNCKPTVICLKGREEERLPLPVSMPSRCICHECNALKILESGIYEINYMLNASASLGGEVTLAVNHNGKEIPSSIQTHLLAVGITSTFNGSIITCLKAGDVLDLIVFSCMCLNLCLNTGTTVSLTVKRIAEE